MSVFHTLSHVERLHSQARDYYLLQGETEAGLPHWSIVKSHARTLQLLARPDTVVDIAQLGVILASGIGSGPPPHTLKTYTI